MGWPSVGRQTAMGGHMQLTVNFFEIDCAVALIYMRVEARRQDYQAPFERDTRPPFQL